MRTLTHLLSLATAATALMGCPDVQKTPLDSGDTGVLDCTTEARASAQLTVVDADGAPIADATATYTDGGEAQPCEAMPDGVLVCGWEVAGPLHIVVEADGYTTEELDVIIESDVCHVITAQVEVILSAAD